MGAPEGLKTQVHSEQPQHRKRCCSTHTSFRLMATLVAAPHRYLTPTRNTVRSPNLGAAEGLANRLAKSTCANLDGLFDILHMHKIFVRAAGLISGPRCEVAESIKCWSRFVRSELARSSGKADVAYPTEEPCSA